MNPYVQRNAPPPNKVNTMTLRDFTGGLNNRSTQLEDHQASDILNMKFTDDTIMEKRTGIEYVGTLDLPAAITYFDTIKPYAMTIVEEKEDELPAVIDVDRYVVASDSEMYVNGVKVADLAGRMMGKNYMGKYFFADGAKLRVYGKFPQVSTTLEKVIGTPVNDYVVMDVVTPPKGFTPAAAPRIIGTYRYDYTNKKIWYEPCKYEVDDTSKGSNVLPNKPKYLEVNKDRMYISGSQEDDDNVFITDIGNGYYTPVYLPIQMPPNSDMVTGLKVFHDSVVVGRKNDVHIIYGNTNRNDVSQELYRLKRVNAHAGFASQQAIEQVTNYLFYVGTDRNIYSMLTPKTDTDMLVTTMLNTQIDINKAPINLSTADLSKAISCYYKDEWYLVIGDKVLIYSYRHRAWTMYYFQNVVVSGIGIQNGELLLGLTTGRIVKFNVSYSDLGVPYLSYWKSKNYDAGQPVYEKFYRDFYIIANSYINAPSTINLFFEVDYIDTTNKFDVQNLIALWGTAVFGDSFFSRNINASKPLYVGQRGRTIRISLQNGYFPSGSVATYADLLNVTGTKQDMLYYVTSESAYYAYEKFNWVKKTENDLYQPMKVFEINGQFEFRGVR